MNADMREKFLVIGAQASSKNPSEFEAMLKAEYEATGKLVSRIGLKVE